MSEDIWSAAMYKAKTQGVTLTSVIIKSLEDYILDAYNNEDDE